MSFWLSNVPASFQGYINKILVKKLDIFIIVYLDDIFIYTKDPSQTHANVVWWFLKELKKNGLFANLKKCRFHKDKVRFLGYVVSAQKGRIEEEKIDTVKNWPEPKSIYNIQVFLGFANFYRCFIQGFSRIAAPLISMLRISPIQTMQKLMNLVDELGKGDRGENEARKASTSIKRLIEADYPSSNHVSHAVSNIVSNSAKKWAIT